MNVLIIDAWGQGLPEDTVKIPEFKAPANYKSEEKIQEYISNQRASWLANLKDSTSTSTLAGVAISKWDHGEHSDFIITASESDILDGLLDILDSYFRPELVLSWKLDEPLGRIRHAAWRHETVLPACLHPIYGRECPRLNLYSLLNKLETKALSFSESAAPIIGSVLSTPVPDRPAVWDPVLVREYMLALDTLALRVL